MYQKASDLWTMLPSFTQSDGSPGKITSQVGNTTSSLTVIYVGDPCSARYPTPTIHNLHTDTLTRGLFKTIYPFFYTKRWTRHFE
jgi:hypothetical protein